MNSETLRELLLEEESLKLEFKQQPYDINHTDASVKDAQRDELIKDILSLANANVGVAAQTGYLIIGAEDEKQPDGLRCLHDVGDFLLEDKVILSRVNSACHPRLPDISCETVVLDGIRLLVLAIPPSPYVYQTTRTLKTKDRKNYRENTVFIRIKEEIAVASMDEIDALRKDKRQASNRRVPFLLSQLDASTFTGRSEELRKMEETLLEDSDTKFERILAVTGGPGMGKSALACHFATVHSSKFPDGVLGIRVDGKDAQTLAREFARCCGEEFAPDDEIEASAIMQSVFSQRRMLLIFDNADSAAIRALRPGGRSVPLSLQRATDSFPLCSTYHYPLGSILFHYQTQIHCDF